MGRNTTQESYNNGSNTPAFAAWLILIGIIVIGGAVYIGMKDSGPINVSATIQESNQALPEGSNDQVSSVSQTFQNMTNGGLVAREGQSEETPQPQVEQASTTQIAGEATTTQETTESEGENTEQSSESTDGETVAEPQ